MLEAWDLAVCLTPLEACKFIQEATSAMPDPDLELFRSVRSDQVLRGCGNVFREKDEYTASAGALPRHVTTRLLDSAADAY